MTRQSLQGEGLRLSIYLILPYLFSKMTFLGHRPPQGGLFLRQNTGEVMAIPTYLERGHLYGS